VLGRRCHGSDGYGLVARECPSKGNGKGWYYKGDGKCYDGDGKGYKGDGKGYKGDGKGYKGDGKGYKKKGKGYQSICFACGEVVPKAAKCRGVHNVEDGQLAKATAEEEVSIGGGLWMIGTVEAEMQDPNTVPKTKVNRHPPGITLRNMFNGLEVSDGIESDDEPEESCGRKQARETFGEQVEMWEAVPGLPGAPLHSTHVRDYPGLAIASQTATMTSA
jgi:hypothetical protein